MKTFRVYVTETWDCIYEVDAESEEQAREFVLNGMDNTEEGFEDCDSEAVETFCLEREITDIGEEA